MQFLERKFGTNDYVPSAIGEKKMKLYVFTERNPGSNNPMTAIKIEIPAWSKDHAMTHLEGVVGHEYTDLWVLTNPD